MSKFWDFQNSESWPLARSFFRRDSRLLRGTLRTKPHVRTGVQLCLPLLPSPLPTAFAHGGGWEWGNLQGQDLPRSSTPFPSLAGLTSASHSLRVEMAPPFLDSGQSAVLPEPPRRADKRDRKTPEAVRVGPANHNCRFLLFTFLFSFFFFFWWDWGLGLCTCRQALCSLSHTSSPFCSGNFGDGIS
jgi:hypothetical protein